MLLGIDQSPTMAPVHRPFLEALLDSDTPLRPLARLLLAGTLSSNRPELQGLAIDALILAIDDGRIDGPRLAPPIRQLLTLGLVKATRLAKALGDVARISPLHAQVVVGTLRGLGFGDAPFPTSHWLALLERLHELLVETGQRVDSADVRSALENLSATGRTGQVIRQILAHEPTPEARSQQGLALARALSARLDRAESWQSNGG
jgi:hypothetical protein